MGHRERRRVDGVRVVRARVRAGLMPQSYAGAGSCAGEEQKKKSHGVEHPARPIHLSTSPVLPGRRVPL